MNSERKINFLYGEVEVEARVSDNVGYTDIDKWVRNRFRFSNEDILVYKDQNGKGYIHIYLHFILHKLVLEIIPIFSRKEKSAINILIEKHAIASKKPSSSSLFETLGYLYVSTLVISYAILWYKYLYDRDDLQMTLVGITMYLEYLGLPVPQAVVNEAFIAFFNWPITYFFIRRMMNPQVGFIGLFEKYGLDSLFGALAASAVILAKNALKI